MKIRDACESGVESCCTVLFAPRMMFEAQVRVQKSGPKRLKLVLASMAKYGSWQYFPSAGAFPGMGPFLCIWRPQQKTCRSSNPPQVLLLTFSGDRNPIARANETAEWSLDRPLHGAEIVNCNSSAQTDYSQLPSTDCFRTWGSWLKL